MIGLDITKRWLTSSATVADVSRNQNGGPASQNKGSVDKARILRQSSKVSFELSHPTPIQDHVGND